MKKLFKFILFVVIIIFLVKIFIPKKVDIPTQPGQDVIYHTNINGQDRQYTVYVPSTYDKETPTELIFVFHGGGSNNVNIENSVGYNEQAESGGFLVVYPLGSAENASSTEPKNQKASWNGGPVTGGYAYGQKVDDVKFVRKIVSEISNKYNIDSGKIFATGISMGGMLTYRLACEASDVFSAIAPVGSVLAIPFDDCKPLLPVSIIHFHGTADKFVPYNGGDSSSSLPKILVVGGPYPSVADTITKFKTLNHTSAKAQEVYNYGDTSCNLYQTNNKQGEIELCTIQGGGHNWPGTNSDLGILLGYILGKVSQDVSATERSIEFFDEHNRN